MGLFRSRSRSRSSGWDDAVPGLGDLVRSWGWEPIADPPFGSRLSDLIHRFSWILYDRPFTRLTQAWGGPGPTVFNNVYEGRVETGRLVVANAWTNIGPQELVGLYEMQGVAVCAVELASLSPFFVLQPRALPPVDHFVPVPTGHPDFDDRFFVAMVPGLDPSVLNEGVRQRISAHEDWAFAGHDSWLVCVSREAFESADEVKRRVDEVVGLVAAFPRSVLPAHVDHSVDDLAQRIRQLHSADDAIVFLEQLTPDERDRLARSDTPLAGFSDIRTRDEAIARFGALDVPQRMQLLAMFKRDDGRDVRS